jgi:hypothetical protein
MDGPRTVAYGDVPGIGRLGRALIDYEARQYAVFTRPEVLAVLRVDPEIAVRRKPSEPAEYVRRRSTEVWNATWDEGVVLVDASRPRTSVLADVRGAVWDHL